MESKTPRHFLGAFKREAVGSGCRFAKPSVWSRAIIKMAGFDWPVPDYSTLCR
ncbi:hypothetical protein M2324_003714 [Rhodovulum sulfidophilum]|nr:hypothetical protein [Rhodovulum sulfidophilum]